MSFTYRRATGEISHNNEIWGTGYSGHRAGVNNPELEREQGIGPIPSGLYTILPAVTSSKVGPIAMHLLPDLKNEMFGRSAFLIHGDNSRGDRSASEGCIILARPIRERIARAVLAGDNRLTVL